MPIRFCWAHQRRRELLVQTVANWKQSHVAPLPIPKPRTLKLLIDYGFVIAITAITAYGDNPFWSKIKEFFGSVAPLLILESNFDSYKLLHAPLPIPKPRAHSNAFADCCKRLAIAARLPSNQRDDTTCATVGVMQCHCVSSYKIARTRAQETRGESARDTRKTSHSVQR